MSSGEPRVPVARLRAAVREAIEHTSSHAVARDVGMSAPPIRAFAAGTNPRPSTIRKLTAWYIRYRQRAGGGTIDSVTAAAAVALLVEHVEPHRRDELREEVYEVIARKTGKAAEAPQWVREVREGAKRGKRKG